MTRCQLLLALLTMTACGGRSPDPPVTAAGPAQAITGRERIGWDQRASIIGAIGWTLYVDGTRLAVADAACTAAPAPELFSCSSRIPPMAPGLHTLELTSFFAGEPDVESARSGALRVDLIPTAAESAPFDAREAVVAASGEDTRFVVERLVDGLDDPADAAFAPDGRLFIGERPDRVTVYRGRGSPLDRTRLADVDLRPRHGIMALALDPAFERTRLVFVLHTVRLEDGAAAFRLSRYREVGGTLGERAILLDRIPASARPSAAMRFGPDGRLWLALDDGDDAEAFDSPVSPNGKVLRLNPDGTTPRDQPAPAVMSGARSPKGLVFGPANVLWLSDGGSGGAGTLVAATPGAMRPSSRRRYATNDAGALAVTRSPSAANDLLMASESGRFLLRIRLDPQDPMRVVDRETILDERFGPIRIVFAGPDAAIYVFTSGALARLTPR